MNILKKTFSLKMFRFFKTVRRVSFLQVVPSVALVWFCFVVVCFDFGFASLAFAFAFAFGAHRFCPLFSHTFRAK